VTARTRSANKTKSKKEQHRKQKKNFFLGEGPVLIGKFEAIKHSEVKARFSVTAQS
jgi:hypothetical protein